MEAQTGPLVSRCETFVPDRTTRGTPLRLVCTVQLDLLRALIAQQARIDQFVPGVIDLGPTLLDDSVVPVVVHGTWRGERADTTLRGHIVAVLHAGVGLLSDTARIQIALDSASDFERSYRVADALPAEYQALLYHLTVRRSSINVASATATEGTVTVDLDPARN